MGKWHPVHLHSTYLYLSDVYWCIWSRPFQEGTGFCVCGGWAPVNWDPWWTVWDRGLCFICCIHAPQDKRLLWEVIFWASWGITSMKSSSVLQLAFLGFDSAAPAGNKWSDQFFWQRINQTKRTRISVIIFYSHMLHFALNVQVILSGQTQKVWVSTYSNVLYSLFIHTGEPQELSVTIYTHYSLAIWLRSFTKWVLQKKEEKKLGKQKKQHAWIQEEVFQVLACFIKIPQCSTMWPSIRKTQMSAVRCLTLQNKNKNKWTSISQARLDKFPLFQKKKRW